MSEFGFQFATSIVEFLSVSEDLGMRSASAALKRTLSRGSWVLAETISVQGISLLTFMVLARLISPKEFGLVAISVGVVYALRSVVIDPFYNFIAGYGQPSDDDYTAGFWGCLLVSGGCFLICEILIGVADLVDIGSADMRSTFAEIALLLPMMGLTRMHETWSNRHYQFRNLAIRSGCGAVAGSGVGIALAVHGMGLHGLVAQQLVSSLVSLTLLWSITPWKPTLAPKRANIHASLRFALESSPPASMAVLSNLTDTVLIGALYGATSAGIYSVAKRLRFVLQSMVNTPIFTVGVAAIANTADSDGRRQTVATCVLSDMSISAPLYFGLAAISDDAIRLCFGPQWGGAAQTLSILCVCGLFAIMLVYTDSIMAMYRRQAWRLLLTALSLGMTWLTILTFGRSGYNVAIWCLAAPPAVVAVISLYLSCKLVELEFRKVLIATALPVAAATVMYVCVRLVAQDLPASNILLRVGVSISVGAALYAAAMGIIWRKKLTALYQPTSRVLRSFRLLRS